MNRRMKSVQIVHTIEGVRSAVAEARKAGQRIGFVPTMGGLHEGHGSLMDRSVSECGFTVVSIFVNALQFGPAEDFQKYPRELDVDAAFCERRGVDLIFAPTHEEMYPREQRTFVEVTGLTDGLCGKYRPGHFRGVTTVVAKLLLAVLPDVAYFGEKDGQQLAVVKRMVADLNFPVEICPVATVREPDGLAMSTRNRYLAPEERRAATAVYRSLQRARALLAGGERDAATVRAAVHDVLAAERAIQVQYVEVVDAEELQPLSYIDGRVMVAVAVYVGGTRLIDNLVYP